MPTKARNGTASLRPRRRGEFIKLFLSHLMTYGMAEDFTLFPMWQACRFPEAADSAFRTWQTFQSCCECSRDASMISRGLRFWDGIAPKRTNILPELESRSPTRFQTRASDSAKETGL